jgi:hypothetical protein
MFVITSCTLFITERLNENLQKRKEWRRSVFPICLGLVLFFLHSCYRAS